jgi:hypothetical protein
MNNSFEKEAKHKSMTAQHYKPVLLMRKSKAKILVRRKRPTSISPNTAYNKIQENTPLKWSN